MMVCVATLLASAALVIVVVGGMSSRTSTTGALVPVLPKLSVTGVTSELLPSVGSVMSQCEASVRLHGDHSGTRAGVSKAVSHRGDERVRALVRQRHVRGEASVRLYNGGAHQRAVVRQGHGLTGHRSVLVTRGAATMEFMLSVQHGLQLIIGALHRRAQALQFTLQLLVDQH